MRVKFFYKYVVFIISNSNNTEKIYDDELDNDLEAELRIILSDKEVIEFGIQEHIVREKLLEYKENYPSHLVVRFGQVTNQFKNYLKGMKMYKRKKERISFYISEDRKKRWRRFLESKEEIPTFSKLIRKAVEYYIENAHYSNNLDIEHNYLALIQHLTVIKGALDFLLKKYSKKLEGEDLDLFQDALDQSILIESKIRTIGDKTQNPENIDLFYIEDNRETMKLLKLISKEKEITFKGARNAQIALEMLKKIKPKIIFMDIWLPDIDGFELCKVIKHDESLKEVPIYYMTCLEEYKVKERMEDTKADGYILKPFEYDDIDRLINEYIPPKPHFNDDDDKYLYPYTFKPPEPPGDLGMATQLQVNKFIDKEPEDPINCPYCGTALKEEERVTHNCRETLK